MRRVFWLILFLGIPGVVVSQRQTFTVFDTMHLEEITISETVPLNDRNVLDLYLSGGLPSIDKINSRLDGMTLVRRGAYAMDPSMHGFSGGQINISIDGMKMFGACTDRMDPITSYVEPENLKSLKITHGTNGGVMGSTVGGTFEMLLREPVIGGKRMFSFMAGSGYETVSKGINSNAAFEINRNKWAFRTSGTFRKHSDYIGGDGNVVPHSEYAKINLHSVVKYELAPEQFIRFDFLLDEAYDVGYPALPMDVGFAGARLYSLEYSRSELSHSISGFKAKAYYNSVYHLMDDSRRDSLYLKEGGTPGTYDSVYMRMDMPGWSDTYGFYLEGEIALGEKNRLFFKLDEYLNYSRANMTMFMETPGASAEPPMYAETWPDSRRNVVGFYASNTTHLNESLSLILDARIDFSSTRVTSETGWQQFSIFEYNVNREYHELPKNANVNLRFRAGHGISIEGGMGYSERLPTVTEQFGFFLYNAHDGYDYLGNPEIAMEKSNHVWGRFHFATPVFKASLRNQFSYVKDYILGEIDSGIPQMNLYADGVKKFRNLDHALVYGAGLQVQWNPLQSLTLHSLTEYTYAITNMQDPLPHRVQDH